MALADPDPAVMPATHHDLPDWPGTMDWQLPEIDTIPRTPRGYVLDYATDLDNERRRLQFEQRRAGGVTDELEEHTIQMRLRVAVLLAVLDQRWTADLDDWRLAGQILNAHRGALRHLRTVITAEAATKRKTANRHAAAREETVTEARLHAEERLKAGRVVKLARRLVDIVAKNDGEITGSVLRKRLRSDERDLYPAAIDHATEAGWLNVSDIDHRGQGGTLLRTGKVKP